MFSQLLEKIQHNWKSGITVSLISMPLSISLAVASGSTPTIGIITAVWAGLIASIFGGSHFNIVGPTGALSGLIASYAAIYGAEQLPMLTIVVGLFIFAAYSLRLERYLVFIPSSAIHGFTLGVALIIAFNQFNSAFGLYGLPKHERFFDNVIESVKHLPDTSFPTLTLFLLFLTSLFILKKFVPKIPGALLVSPLGIFIGYLSSTGAVSFDFATLGSVFHNITFRLYEPIQFSFSSTLLLPGAAIALVAVLETMLSAKIADGMTNTKHHERSEMFGLGLANLVSGVMGGIPATAALARTSLNIKTGATDKISATISSITLVIISYFLLTSFQYIPMAVIAAILVYVAIQMIEAEHFARFYRYQRSGFWLSLLVAAITFYEDPIIGILLGTSLALLLFVERLSRGHFDIKLNSLEKGLITTISGDKLDEIEENADILLYSMKGKLAYINSRAHTERFEKSLTTYKVIILRLRSVYFIDLDGAEAIDEIIETIHNRNQTVCLTSLNATTAALLEKVSPQYRKLKEAGLIFEKSEQALRHFGFDPTAPKSV